MTSPAPAIFAQDLRLTLGSKDAPVEVLKGICLTVPQGQTLALLGPSGSGKSSLMAVLSGLERASSGAIAVAGENFAAMDEDALARARRGRIGIVLQAFHLLPTMTAQENVQTPLELAGIAAGRERARRRTRRASALATGCRTIRRSFRAASSSASPSPAPSPPARR